MPEFILKDGSRQSLKCGERIAALAAKQQQSDQIYAVIIDNELYDLHYQPKQGGQLSFVYAQSSIGKRIYERTLSFVFITAVQLLFPDSTAEIQHSLSNGLYCSITHKPFLTLHDVEQIQAKMDFLINRKEAIISKEMDRKAAIQLFEQNRLYHKAALLRDQKEQRITVNQLGDSINSFYGILLPDCGYLTHYALRYYAPGIWLSAYPHFQDQPKMFQAFQEYMYWGNRMQVAAAAQLNRRLKQGKGDELVLMCETMMEKQLAELASKIVNDRPQTRFILIAGPSSAGKTTFSRRLSIHLKILGIDAHAISMDDFYKNRSDTLRTEDGSYDFESLEAVDLTLFQDTLLKLIHQIPVYLPKYDFKRGIQVFDKKKTKLGDKQVLIIEGIHGLNPKTSRNLPANAVCRVYINALTNLNLDEHNRISTSDYRLIRRIVRDYRLRGWDSAETIAFWENVRRGEEQNIYPYQEDADYVFNTSMVYELAVLKQYAVPLLEAVTQECPQYLEAKRLLQLLSLFHDSKADAVPRCSVLAEFIGTSILDVS